METEKREFQTNTILICVDQCGEEGLQGRIRSRSEGDAEQFYSLLDLLLKLERRMDQGEGYPRAYMAPRSFWPAREPEREEPPAPEVGEGQVATFAVRVLFRKNASWQGSVSWLEGRREENFRSALELIFLMNSALQGM